MIEWLQSFRARVASLDIARVDPDTFIKYFISCFVLNSLTAHVLSFGSVVQYNEKHL